MSIIIIIVGFPSKILGNMTLVHRSSIPNNNRWILFVPVPKAANLEYGKEVSGVDLYTALSPIGHPSLLI